MFASQGLRVEPLPAMRGRNVTITYKGLLAQAAETVFLHYGYDGWVNPQTVAMTRKPDGSFQVSIPANGQREINFCFKDGADHWDNNQGKDWHCLIL